MEREHQSVAKAVSVKQLGGRERNIVRLNAQDTAGVILATVDPIAVQVHGCFWPARAARRPQPQGHIILAGGRRLQVRRRILDESIPMEVSLNRLPADHDVRAVTLAGEGGTEFSDQR